MSNIPTLLFLPMKVKATQSFITSDSSFPIGHEFDCQDERLEDWLESGLVVPVKEQPETATTKRKLETATLKHPKAEKATTR